MRRFRTATVAVLLVLASLPAAVWAEPTSSPLRYVPHQQAELVIQIDNPREAVETILKLDLAQRLNRFPAVRELYDSTNARRFYQLVAYFEKQLGAPWPDLLDRLAGGGAVLGARFDQGRPEVVLAIQSKDEALLKKFVVVAGDVLEQELARQDARARLKRTRYLDVEGIKLDDNLHAAVIGSALVLGSSEGAMHQVVDTHRNNNQSLMSVPALGDAYKLLTARDKTMPLAWACYNLGSARGGPNAKEIFELPRNEAQVTLLFGGWLDVARRAPFIAAGLSREATKTGETIRLQVAMPQGREGINPSLTLHVPPRGQPGTLPLLEPKGTLYSSSYYLDLGEFWEKRTKLLTEKQVKDFEQFDKNSGRFLAGNTMHQLLSQAGPHQRIVVTYQEQHGYKKVPTQRLPAFAFVVDMRQPAEFSRSMETVLRGAALLGGIAGQLKLIEEKHSDLTIIGYRFPEDKPFQGDVNGIRFNFSPCFVAVGDQYLVSSTLELAHELIDLLQKEAKTPKKIDPAITVRSRAYAAGGADYLQSVEDQLLAQTILDQAVAPAEAKDQVKDFIALVRKLGILEGNVRYGDKDFRVDVQLKMMK